MGILHSCHLFILESVLHLRKSVQVQGQNVPAKGRGFSFLSLVSLLRWQLLYVIKLNVQHRLLVGVPHLCIGESLLSESDYSVHVAVYHGRATTISAQA